MFNLQQYQHGWALLLRHYSITSRVLAPYSSPETPSLATFGLATLRKILDVMIPTRYIPVSLVSSTRVWLCVDAAGIMGRSSYSVELARASLKGGWEAYHGGKVSCME